VRIDKSLLGTVVRKRLPLRVADVQKNTKFQNIELAEREGVRSLLAVPVIYQEEVLAVLAVYAEDARRWRESEVRLLQLIANQGAMAIENGRRMERLQVLEDNLRQAERFSLLGTLAAEIAHEIRNPITIINLLMHSIREAPGQTDQTRNDLAIVTEKLERINQIVEQTLNLARSSESRREETHINQLIEELLLFLSFKLSKAHITVETSLDAKLPPIQVDSGQIQQVLLNLMVNALESMKPGGTLRVRTRLASDRSLGPCVRCLVEDTGIGIPPENLETIFNPFFTTRPDGTGLGLFISNKLVRRHGGTIRVKSTPGAGSTFTVTLPLNPETGEE
jgi:signal transduction histidine kinase